jgi:isopentenyl-diphosphate delta-isomerase
MLGKISDAMTIMIPTWVDGSLTPVEKLSAHQRGLKHKAVSVFINRGEQTLIQRRALGKYHTGGLWANACCTHPEWEEAPAACAERRVREELGVTGIPLTFAHHTEYRADVGNGLIEHEVVDIFVGKAPIDLTLALNPAEVMDAEWVNIDDLIADISERPARYTPWLHIYLNQHRGALFPDT